jgi:2,4-dienoyl-CoA reductase-like NADH-dependent reductase (Old Yellow Enzyme family)
LTLEVVEAVQSEWPENLPLFVDFSNRLGRRWLELEESVQLSKILKEKELI